MNVIVNFHQLEPTEAIREMAEKKSKKLKKFFSGNAELKWTLKADSAGHHAHALLSADGYALNADSVKEDMYKTFDDVVAKLEKQLIKKKSSAKDHLHRRRVEAFEEELEEEEF